MRLFGISISLISWGKRKKKELIEWSSNAFFPFVIYLSSPFISYLFFSLVCVFHDKDITRCISIHANLAFHFICCCILCHWILRMLLLCNLWLCSSQIQAHYISNGLNDKMSWTSRQRKTIAFKQTNLNSIFFLCIDICASDFAHCRHRHPAKPFVAFNFTRIKKIPKFNWFRAWNYH